jgi:hypothetical protein
MLLFLFVSVWFPCASSELLLEVLSILVSQIVHREYYYSQPFFPDEYLIAVWVNEDNQNLLNIKVKRERDERPVG